MVVVVVVMIVVENELKCDERGKKEEGQAPTYVSIDLSTVQFFAPLAPTIHERPLPGVASPRA